MNTTILGLYKSAGLSDNQISKMPDYLMGNVDFADSDAYEKLFDFFAFESQEMPPSVASAESDDPSFWIIRKLLLMCSKEITGASIAVATAILDNMLCEITTATADDFVEDFHSRWHGVIRRGDLEMICQSIDHALNIGQTTWKL